MKQMKDSKKKEDKPKKKKETVASLSKRVDRMEVLMLALTRTLYRAGIAASIFILVIIITSFVMFSQIHSTPNDTTERDGCVAWNDNGPIIRHEVTETFCALLRDEMIPFKPGQGFKCDVDVDKSNQLIVRYYDFDPQIYNFPAGADEWDPDTGNAVFHFNQCIEYNKKYYTMR